MNAEQLQSIQNQELKYKDICKALSIPEKTGNTKIAQINQISRYCDLQVLSNPTRYVVGEIYDEKVVKALSASGQNKYQLLFDAMVYQSFVNNHGRPMYLSAMDFLKLFQEVNDNFSYACNLEQMAKMGDDYVYMTIMSQTAYKILRQWTQARLNYMRTMSFITVADGFRLYVPHIGKHGFYKTIYHPEFGSPDHQFAQTVYTQATEEIMPKGWGEMGTWVPEWQWRAFEKRLAELVKEKSDGKYIDVKKVTIISPPEIDWLDGKLDRIYNELANISDINIEGCRKILETTQLNSFTDDERKKFVEINMGLNPPIKFRQELRNKKEGS